MKDSAYDHIWVIESDSSDVTVMSPTVFFTNYQVVVVEPHPFEN